MDDAKEAKAYEEADEDIVLKGSDLVQEIEPEVKSNKKGKKSKVKESDMTSASSADQKENIDGNAATDSTKQSKTTMDIEALKSSSVVIEARDNSMMVAAPKSYYQFERDFKSLKKEREKLVKYLLNIKEADVKSIFKSDLETDMILDIFSALTPESDEFFATNSVHIFEFTKGLVSVKPFEMACEFLMDDEKDTIKNYISKMDKNSKSVNASDLKKVKGLFGKYCQIEV